MDSTYKLDENCKHEFENELITQCGIVFNNFKCKKCSGVIYHILGEKLEPLSKDIKELLVSKN